MGAPDEDIGLAKTETPVVTDAPTIDTVSGKLDERPEADQLARAVARTRIGNKLFAKEEKVNLGRYHLLELVGSGGMGVVWGAWDPELERRVAIKLVKATMQAARDRIQLEGQALAKLSHPNVVTVYDVGVVGDQVYIVMEWVRGQNLRAYGKPPRTAKDVIAVYRAAGEGLAAAHAAGLIHRDFKPDNAIRGDDGRVRVLDFGLARNEVVTDDGSPAASSEMTRGAGTPRYMPPEQAEGRPLTPAVDQFAFCVSLREALVEVGGVPSWIEAIVARGSAKDPKDRFASMPELLHALGRDPARIWRRRAIVVGALGATAAAFVVGNLRAANNAVEPCSGSHDEIGRVWNAQSRGKLSEHLKTLGAYGVAEASRLDGELGKYAEQWAVSHHTACIASERGELPAALYEKNLVCLDRARAGFEQAIEILANVPAERVSEAIVASRSLPDTERCSTEAATSTVEPPKPAIAGRANELGKAISRMRVLAMAGDPAAERGAAEIVGATQQLGYPPLIAQAYLVQGIERLARRDLPAAIDPLERATFTALDASDDPVFVEAYAREIYGIAITEQANLPATATATIGSLPFVERVARRLGVAASFERPLLWNNIGILELSRGNTASARDYFTKAANEPRTRAGDIELGSAISNLGLVIEDPAQRTHLFEQRAQQLATQLGPTHPMTIDAAFLHALSLRDPRQAADRLRDVCARYERVRSNAVRVALGQCAYQLGYLAEERGDLSEARSAMLLAENAYKPAADTYLAFIDGQLDETLSRGDIAWREMKADWWLRVIGADTRLLAARCYSKRGAHERAIATLRELLATYDQVDANKNEPYVQRRVARAQAMLATELAKQDAGEAVRLADAALRWYRAAGGYESQISSLEALVSSRSR